MIQSMLKEIKQRKNYINGEKINSIYFGGGTPSILNIAEIKKFLSLIFTTYITAKDLEITIECNPEDLTSSKLSSFKKIGINRLSIGVQSFNNADLKFMNRSHDSKQAIRCIKEAKKIGFINITIDLIYGVPKQTLKDWNNNLKIMFNLGIQHFSAYSLTVEKKTALYNLIENKKVSALSDKNVNDHFKLVQKKAKEKSFIHYEISNYAKKNYFSKHNTTYWTGKHYLGIGPSAHSYNGTSRSWNVSSNKNYISKIHSNSKYFDLEKLTTEQSYNEYIFTSLRTMWGANKNIIKKKFGSHIESHFLKEVNKWEKKKYINYSANVYTLTEKGKVFADGIASDLFIVD